MNKKRAKEISETISNEALLHMLNVAMLTVTDWTKPSKANRGLSRGYLWNLFCKDFDVNETYKTIRKFRMVQEFGEFLPSQFQPNTNHKKQIRVAHEEPDFKNFKAK